MGTNYIAPIWRMPRNANKDKLSNYSIDFGSTDYINFDSFPDIAENNCYSFSFWFKTSSTSNAQVICDDAQTNLFELRTRFAAIQVIDAISGRVSDTQQLQTNVAAVTNDVRDGDWHHIAFIANTQTHDPTISNPYVANLYLDGYRATKIGFASPTTLAGVMASTLRLNNSFTGQISQFCFFNRVLSDGGVNQYELAGGEVAQLYNLTNPMIFSAPPVVYTPLGDNSNPNENAVTNETTYPNISVGADSVFDFSTQDYIESPHIDMTGAMSISGWFKTTDTGYNMIYQEDEAIRSPSGPNRNWFFSTVNNVLRFAQFYDSGGSSVLNTTGVTVNDGNWHHGAFVWDGTTNTDSMKIFVDGILRGKLTAAKTDRSNDNITGMIGGSNATYDMNGELSNIQIWNTNLTYGTASVLGDIATGEVAELYNNGQPLMTGTQPQESNLQAWYKLNQSANWEADTAGNWQIPDAVSAYPQSFDFDTTSNNYIDAGTGLGDSLGTYTGDLTISFWFNSQSANNNNNGLFYIGSFSNAQGTIQVVLSNSGNIIRLANGASNRVTATITSYNDNNWHHFVFIYKAGDINNSTIYIDGSELDPGFYTRQGTFPSSINLTGLKTIIGGYYSSAYTVDGLLSNLELWNTELSSSQVETLYNNGTPLTTAIAPANLKAWYKLDNTELFDGTNWSVENQKYPANWESSFNSGASTGMLRDNDSKSEYDNQLFSMSVWVKPKSGVTTSGDIFACRGSSWQGVSLSYNGNDLVFQIGDKNTTAINGQGGNWSYFNNRVAGASPTYTPYDQWSHIVVVWNGTNSKFYINGTLVSTITPPSALTIDYSFTGTISAIGGRNDAGGAYFTGNISNFAYWESELDQTAVTALYNNGTPEVTISQSPNHWFTLKDFATGSVDQIGSLNYENTIGTVEFVDNFVSIETGTSSNMTEQNLVNNNVSVLNGESSGMNTTNLVQSNLTRTQPYSNYSFNFDSISSDYFDLGGLQGTALQPSNATLISDGFSVSVWVNLDDTSTFRTFWQNDGLGNANYYGLIFLMNTGGQLNIGYNNGGAAGSGSRKNYITTAAQITSTGTWYHVVAIYKGIAVTPGLYVNGVEITAFNAPTGSATTLAYSPSAKGSIGIGRNAIQPMEGKISNCACFDRTLTQDEILNIYNNGVPQNLQATSTFSNNIVAWWPMDGSNSYYDGTNWVVRDLENGKDGTGVNTGNVDDLVGNAPGSDASGTGNNLTIADLKGDMYNSDKNAYSINMGDYADGVTNPANSGRSTDTP